MSESNKTWAAFWSENKPLVWFIVLAFTAILVYLIYNNWNLKFGEFSATPPEKTKEVVNPPNEQDKNHTLDRSKVKDIEPNIKQQTQRSVTTERMPIAHLIKISLIVDAEFEKGAIFINEKQVYPVNETPTIKYLEIEYQPNIRVEVKSGSQTCSVKKSISESDINHQIQLTCVQ